MRKKLLAFTPRPAVVWAMVLLSATAALGQSAASVSRTQCKQWDDAFLTIFNWALAGSLLGACVFSLLSGFLGKFLWVFTTPRLRIVVVTMVCLLAAVLGVAFGPWTLGLGGGLFSGVDPRYFDCASMQFGAEGLFAGQLGRGVPAIAQTPAMIIALSAAALIGGLAAWLISSAALRFIGVPAKVRGERL
jgi:hypothetical protein